jgi:parallel beta-helix repeat protein
LSVTQPVARRTVLVGALVLAAAANIDAQSATAAPARQRFAIGDYGARSDGSTDDSAAIRAASEAASKVRGIVVIPTGTTVWNDLATWYPDVVYLGEAGAVLRNTLGGEGGPKVTAPRVGFRRITFRRGSDSSPFLRLQAADQWIRDCDFWDRGSPKSTGVNLDPGATRAVVKNNRFHHIRSTAIFLDSTDGALIEGNSIKGQHWEVGYQSAIQVVNTAKDTTIRRNVVRISPTDPTPMNGIGLAGTGVLVELNTLRVSRFAIEAGPDVRGTIRRNFCSISSTPVTDGLNYAAGISLPKTTGMTVVGNTVDQQAATRETWVGIELPESTGCVVRDNVLYGSRHGSQGIILDAANACRVQDNTVINYPTGITIYGHAASASKNTVAGNTIVFSGAEATNAGVSVLLDATGSADDNLVDGNVITGPGAGTGVRLDRQVGSGSLDGNRVRRNRVRSVDTSVHRRGDTGTAVVG